MTPEERKEYNKRYYESQKEVISNKHKLKVQCELCGRFVSKHRYKYHKETELCFNTQEYNAKFMK